MISVANLNTIFKSLACANLHFFLNYLLRIHFRNKNDEN